jgi:hypothetical protein
VPAPIPAPKTELSPADIALLQHINQYYTRADSQQMRSDTLTKAEIAKLQTGDVLLRRGFGIVSEFIANYLGETYPITHCGMLIVQSPDSILVLHTQSDNEQNGILYQSLPEFVRQSQEGTLAAVRLKVSTAQKMQMLAEFERLRRKGVRFDMGFDDADTTEMYCAELKKYVFKQVTGVDILPDRATRMGIDVIRMSNFFNPQYFEPLFNHLDTTKL